MARNFRGESCRVKIQMGAKTYFRASISAATENLEQVFLLRKENQGMNLAFTLQHPKMWERNLRHSSPAVRTGIADRDDALAKLPQNIACAYDADNYPAHFLNK